MKRFTTHQERWGYFVDVKINAVQLFKSKKKSLLAYKGKSVLLGSVTDAYQPLEKKYGITRGLLEELSGLDLDVSILTKSDLVLRDIDILKNMKKVSVGITITATDDAVRKVIEPGASAVAKRLETLKTLHNNGIATYVFVGPIIPGLTDLRGIFQALQGSVDEVFGETLNVKSGNFEGLLRCISDNFNAQRALFIRAVNNKYYWDRVEAEFKALCREYRIPLAGFFRH
mgnify:CR=1 FL=1